MIHGSRLRDWKSTSLRITCLMSDLPFLLLFFSSGFSQFHFRFAASFKRLLVQWPQPRVIKPQAQNFHDYIFAQNIQYLKFFPWIFENCNLVPNPWFLENCIYAFETFWGFLVKSLGIYTNGFSLNSSLLMVFSDKSRPGSGGRGWHHFKVLYSC